MSSVEKALDLLGFTPNSNTGGSLAFQKAMDKIRQEQAEVESKQLEEQIRKVVDAPQLTTQRGVTAMESWRGVVTAMESWREVWRNGFAKVLPKSGLESLRKALVDDDGRLIQGATTTPPLLMCVQDCPVEAACALGFCGWQGTGLKTVGEVEEFFAKSCFDADTLIGEPAACRWFLNWFDDTPRDVMRRELIAEIDLIIKESQ